MFLLQEVGRKGEKEFVCRSSLYPHPALDMSFHIWQLVIYVSS